MPQNAFETIDPAVREAEVGVYLRLHCRNMDSWHFADDTGSQHGPVDVAKLRTLFADGSIDGLTLVWKPGMPAWQPLGETTLRATLQVADGGNDDGDASTSDLSSSLRSVATDSSAEFLFAVDGVQQGPVGVAVLKEMLAQRNLLPSTLVWRQGLASWQPASAIAELQISSAGASDADAQSNATTLTGAKRSRAQLESAESDRAGAATRAAQASAHLDALADAHERDIAADGNAIGLSDGKAAADGGHGAAEAHEDSSAAARGGRGGKGGRGGSRGGRSQHQQQHQKQREQTWVYITGLPPDVTVPELVAHFKRAGVVAIHYETGEPRVKIYRAEAPGAGAGAGASSSAASAASAASSAVERPCKGDGSLCYLKEASVELAVTLLDGVELRPGVPLHVEPASFAPKAGSAAGDGSGGSGGSGSSGAANLNGAAAGAGKSKKRVLGSVRAPPGGAGAGSSAAGLTKEQAAAAKAREAAQKAALSWAEEGDESLGMHIIVLRHMFSPADMAGDPAFADEFEEDVAGEALRFGAVEKLNIFSKHPDGIVQIKYASAGAAAEALQAFNGRFFGGRRITAEFWDGVTNFLEEAQQHHDDGSGSGSGSGSVHAAGGAGEAISSSGADHRRSSAAAAGAGRTAASRDEEEERKRLDEFGAWLESGGGGGSAGAAATGASSRA